MVNGQKNQLVDFWKHKFNFNKEVIEAFEKVNREDFLLPETKSQAYEDIPLPLIRGKTISQPSTVMMMTAALELKKGQTVFEIGTGSGYQTAIISKIIGEKGKIISCEVIPELVMFSKKNLNKAAIQNVTVREDDGSKGDPGTKFDRIIITAASKEFPKELLDQLKIGGLIVGPVGNKYEQEMVVGRKDKNGKLELEFLGQFLFSPLYGKYGFED